MSKERLVELLTKTMDEQYEKRQLITPQHTADYLLVNGVIVPPCKVGDRIWQTDGVRIYESSVHEITYTASKTIYITENIVFDETAIGESIFLTRSQAKAKLIEGGEGE
jgi:hypothetical protein